MSSVLLGSDSRRPSCTLHPGTRVDILKAVDEAFGGLADGGAEWFVGRLTSEVAGRLNECDITGELAMTAEPAEQRGGRLVDAAVKFHAAEIESARASAVARNTVGDGKVTALQVAEEALRVFAAEKAAYLLQVSELAADPELVEETHLATRRFLRRMMGLPAERGGRRSSVGQVEGKSHGKTVEQSGTSVGPKKGKDTNARMWTVFMKKPESLGWSLRQWADYLDRAPSTVQGTKTWRELLLKARSAGVAVSTDRMDQSNTSRRGRRRPRNRSS